MKCSLCHSENIISLHKIQVKDLNKIYKKYYNIEVTYLFPKKYIELLECKNCSLRFFYPAVAGDEKFYNQLQNLSFYYVDDKSEFNFALKYINEGANVLEVGSGRGNFAKKLKNCNYTGLDFSINAKEMALKDGITILNEPIEEHAKLHNEEYDIVCSFQVLEHIINIHDYLEACVKSLKPGGIMIHAVPSEDSYLSIAPNDILNHPPHHCSRWKDKALQSIANIFNLELVEIYHEKLNPVHISFYKQTILLSKILKALNYKYKPIDNNLIFSIANKLSAIYANNFEKSIPENTFGNSVTAVYRKKV